MDIAPRIDVISDAICPWCYIGKRHLEAALSLLRDDGLDFEVRWHAYQLNPDMPVAGVERAAYRAAKFGSPERARELDERIVSAAAAVGLGIRPDLMLRTPNTVAAHRVAWLAGQSGAALQGAVVDAMFRAYFVEGQDIGDGPTLARIAATAGMDEDAVTEMLAGESGRREVLAEDAQARAAGLDGVPTFVIANHVLFSGAMPADVMAEAFAKAWRVLKRAA